MAEQKKKSEKEAFVSSEDRPKVTIDPDKPITELKVRDLSAILGQVHLKKPEFKEWIKEKPEFKEIKIEKIEKWEKFELKDLKPEKFEFEPVKRIGDQFEIPDPRVIEQILDSVRNVGSRVDKLQDQLAALEKKLG